MPKITMGSDRRGERVKKRQFPQNHAAPFNQDTAQKMLQELLKYYDREGEYVPSSIQLGVAFLLPEESCCLFFDAFLNLKAR